MIAMKRPMILLALLHLVGNALLLGLGYYWLGVGESSNARLALSAALIAVFVAGGAWLHGTALDFFRQDRSSGTQPSLRVSLTQVAKRLLLLVALAIATFALYLWLDSWDRQPLVVWIASFSTMTLQKPVRPAAIAQVVGAVFEFLRWCILPVLLVPLASGVASRGLSGVTEFGARLRDWRYWIATPALLLIGIWLPLWLASWTPVRGAFNSEMASLILRLGFGYLLFVGACLALAFVTSRGKPAVSQLSTVPSP